MTRESDVLFASAARTDSGSPHASNDLSSHANPKGIILYLDISASSGTSPTLDIKIQHKDPNGNYIDLTGAAFAQKVTTGQDYLTIYPGIAETANETVSDILPGTYRALATIAGTTPSFTFTLDAQYVV